MPYQQLMRQLEAFRFDIAELHVAFLRAVVPRIQSFTITQSLLQSIVTCPGKLLFLRLWGSSFLGLYSIGLAPTLARDFLECEVRSGPECLLRRRRCNAVVSHPLRVDLHQQHHPRRVRANTVFGG